ncbi:MAG: hypothetical protein IPM71_09630 [Bacteroidota bacterium]|nr:MAG: hypothetical protein IPM71_09630 [Bacteroidota bacterium]
MKMRISELISMTLFAASMLLLLTNQYSCSTSKIPTVYPVDTLSTNVNNQGAALSIYFERGITHNHPLMAIWITDTNNRYIETLYVAKSIAKGVFEHGDKSTGKWLAGALRRPAALPVWAHNRGVRETDGLYIPTQETPMPDAVTGATPANNFVLNTRLTKESPQVIDVYFEINQPWDWNEYWTTTLHPEDAEYKTSCQPALVYKTRIELNNPQQQYVFELIGHSKFNGSSGDIFPDLSTITTAKDIAAKIEARLIQ